MPKEEILREEDYWIAWQIYEGIAFISIDDDIDNNNPNKQKSMGNKLLPPSTSNPEKELLQKEAISLLSDEAKQVVDMLVNSPIEMLKAISTPTGHITKRSIRLGMQKIWHSKFIAKKVIEELTQWANQL